MTVAVTVIVVAYNRKELLLRCLQGLSSQSAPAERLLVIDNDSVDGTGEALRLAGWFERPAFELLQLSENLGGAGGFARGIAHALDHGRSEWFWLMDDDAEPDPFALERLMEVATQHDVIYGATATAGDRVSWAVTLDSEMTQVIEWSDEVPDLAPVISLPFLGFLVHRKLVERIGLPEAGYFIAADDVEYCLRARRAGAKLMIVGRSRVNHPQTPKRTITLLGLTISYLSLSPWKRYYDTRNRLLVARRYHGIRLLTQTVPGSLLRLLVAVAVEPQKRKQILAFSAGFVDGLLGRMGKRHQLWGIDQ